MTDEVPPGSFKWSGTGIVKFRYNDDDGVEWVKAVRYGRKPSDYEGEVIELEETNRVPECPHGLGTYTEIGVAYREPKEPDELGDEYGDGVEIADDVRGAVVVCYSAIRGVWWTEPLKL